MLSYQHSYHAGNHADIVKHLTLMFCLEHQLKKPKPIAYIDTHAGDGVYRIDGSDTRGHTEADSGICRLWQEVADGLDGGVPDGVARFRERIRRFNDTTDLLYYPGSAALAADILRADDTLTLFELHPKAYSTLSARFGDDDRATVEQVDGLAGMPKRLPPPSRRGLVLIDPPYERDDEYDAVLAGLGNGLRRFATGTFAVWYPILAKPRRIHFASELKAVGPGKWLHIELAITGNAHARGMTGSGMVVFNPPWTLQAELDEAMVFVAPVLMEDASGGYCITVNE